MLNKNYFKPEGELTFKSAVFIRSQLYKALMERSAASFCLDLSQVTHCDSAGLALLIEAGKLCRKNKKNFEVIGMSEEIQSLAEFCGVKNILESISELSLC